MACCRPCRHSLLHGAGSLDEDRHSRRENGHDRAAVRGVRPSGSGSGGAGIPDEEPIARPVVYPNRYTPIPPNGKRCEFTGMKHAKLYDMLSVGGIARNKVRVANLRSPGTNRGQTLFHVGDMLRFLDELAAEQMRLDSH